MSHFNTEKYLRYRGFFKPKEITSDRPCHSCGYNLRGLKIRGRCPECGILIEEQIKAVMLMDASFEYLKQFRMGTVCLAIGCWMPLATIALAFLSPNAITGIAGMGMALVGPVIFAIGGWIITRPKPDEKFEKRPWYAASNLIRVLLILGPILGVSGVIAGGSLGVTLEAISFLGSIAVTLMLCWLLSDFAIWAGDDAMGRGYMNIFWLILCGSVLTSSCVVTVGGGWVCVGLLPMICLIVGYFWFVLNAARMAYMAHQAVKYKLNRGV